MTCCQKNNHGRKNDYQSYLDRRHKARPDPRPAPSQYYTGGYSQYQAPRTQYMPVYYYIPYDASSFGSFGGGSIGGGSFGGGSIGGGSIGGGNFGGSFGSSSFNNSFSSILQLLLGQLLGGSTGSSLGGLFGGSTGSSLGSLFGGSTGGFTTTTGSTTGSSNLFGGTTITVPNQTSSFQFK